MIPFPFQRGKVSRPIFMGVSTDYPLTEALINRDLLTGYAAEFYTTQGSNILMKVYSSTDISKVFKLGQSGRHLYLSKENVLYPNLYEVTWVSVPTGDPAYHGVIIKNVYGVTDVIPTDFDAIVFNCPRAKTLTKDALTPPFVHDKTHEFYFGAQDKFQINGRPLNGYQWMLLPKANPTYNEMYQWKWATLGDYYQLYDYDNIPTLSGINIPVLVKNENFSFTYGGAALSMQLIMWKCYSDISGGSATPTIMSAPTNLLLNDIPIIEE